MGNRCPRRKACVQYVSLRRLVAILAGRASQWPPGAGDKAWLSLASIIGFAVPFLLSPIWSRAYPVDYFAATTLVQIIPGLLGGWSTLAYHAAIFTPQSDEDAFALTTLALLILLLVAGCLLLVILIGGHWLAAYFLKQPQVAELLWLSPCLLLCAVASNVIDGWLARNRLFRAIGVSSVVQLLGATLVPMAGLASPTLTNFVLLGAVAGSFAGLVARLSVSRLPSRWMATPPSLGSLRRVAAEYANFPRDVLPSQILSGFSGQLVQIVLARGFDGASVAHYSRAGTLLNAPSTILAKPFAVAFSEEAGRAYREKGSCRDVHLRTLGKLFLVMTPIYLTLAVSGPWLYPWFYGSAWADTGLFAQPLAISIWAATVASPLAEVMNFGRNTKWDLLWQTIRLALIALCLLSPGRPLGVLGVLWSLALANCTAYAIYLWMSYHFAMRRDR